MLKQFISAIQAHRLFTAVLIGYAALAFGFSVANPIYESTDELHHFRYIRYLQQFGQLPEQRADQPRIQAHHPPLYYLIAALATSWITPDRDALYEPLPNPYFGYRQWEINNDNKNHYLHGADEAWPYHGVVLMVHVARWVNVILGAIMVWVTYRIGLAIFPARKFVAASAAAMVAFNPQFLFMSGAVNNDVIAGLSGSILLLLSLNLIRDGLTTRRALGLGIAFGLALMAKFNLAFALPLIELALLIAIWPQRDWRGFLKANAILIGCVAVIAGWWFVRNLQLYGEPTGVVRMNELWGGRDPRTSFWLAVSEIPYAWTSLWGRFGYGQIPLPDTIYLGALVVTLMGLAGLIVMLLRRKRLFNAIQIKQISLVVFAAVLFAGALFGYMLSSTAGPMGRFYFPGLSAFGLLLTVGLMQFAGPKRPETSNTSRRATLALLARASVHNTQYAVPIAAFALALVAFFGYFIPAYAAPAILAESQLKITQPINVTFDGKAELVGAEIDRTNVQPGDPIRVTLYWRALAPMDQPYVEFVHVIDRQGIIVAQRDTWPGRGMYPTVLWQPGQLFADALSLTVPDGAYAPNDALIQVGLYDAQDQRLTAIDAAGQAIDQNAVTLGEVAIAPRAGEWPNATLVNFGNKVELIGYEMAPSTRSILPGEAITVTLYWRNRGAFEADYSVFLQALRLRPNPPTSAADTGKPIHDSFSTQTWLPGQVISDVRVLWFPPTAKPGQLNIEVGWFLPKAGRLGVLADDGHVLDSKQLLSPIRIREK